MQTLVYLDHHISHNVKCLICLEAVTTDAVQISCHEHRCCSECILMYVNPSFKTLFHFETVSNVSTIHPSFLIDHTADLDLTVARIPARTTRPNYMSSLPCQSRCLEFEGRSRLESLDRR